MTRKEKAKKIRTRRRIIFLSIALIFFGGIGIRAKFINKASADSLTARLTKEDHVVLKSGLIKDLEDNIAAKDMEKQEEELYQVRAEIKEQKRLEELERDKNRKIAYLTFDDGPSTKSTPQILDILKQYDVKATFFVLGRMVDTNPEILKRVHEEGHAIGHHSYSHDYKYIYANTNNFMGEIHKTNNSLKRVLGEDFSTNLLRLPGGAYGEKRVKYVKAANKEGYESYNWNALNGDSEGHHIPKDRLVQRLKSTVGGQREVVILMHDTDAKDTTVQSLPESIQYLKDQGYEFRTLE